MPERSPHQADPWPPGVPKPGDVTWPGGAVRWLNDTFPENHWRWVVLADNPWMLALTVAARLRADIEVLRAEYRITARKWAPFLPPATAQKLLAAMEKEGNRLKVLLTYVHALENALSPTHPELKPESAPGGDVSAAP